MGLWCVRLAGIWRLAFYFELIVHYFMICKKKYRTPFGMNILSLCIADILACITFLLYACIMIGVYSGSVVATGLAFKSKTTFQVCIYITIAVSLIHILIIATQRLCAIIFPCAFNHWLTIRRCKLLLITAWVIGLPYGIAYSYYHIVAIVSCYQIIIVGIALVAVYCTICYKSSENAKRRTSMTFSQNKQNERIILHSTAVTIVFIACKYPYSINYLFIANNRTLRKYFYGLIALRPLMDPLIYFFVNHLRERNRVSAVTTSHVGRVDIAMHSLAIT